MRRPSPTTLARASARRPWLTLATWAVLLVAAGAVIAMLLSGNLQSGMDLLTRPDSKRGADLLAQRLPQPNTELVIVKSATATVDQPQFKDYVAGLTGKLRTLQPDVVAGVQSYYETEAPVLVSADRHTLLVPVAMKKSQDAAQKDIPALRTALSSVTGPGFRTLVVGTSSVGHDFSQAAEEDLAKGEGIGLPLALIVLLIVFGTVVAAFLPLTLAVIAIVLALALTALLGEGLSVSVFATNIITTMGFAVGIDYTLFIVSRFREELAAGRSKLDAVTVASGTAGRAVLFSGMTVVFALLGMLVVPSTIFTSLGAGAILVVAMAVLASLTLLPAVLMLLGTKVNRLRLPYLGRRLIAGRKSGRASAWGRLAERVMRRPVIALVVGIGLLLLAASPIIDMKTGVSNVNGLPDGFEAKQAFAVLERDFSGGMISPVEIVVAGKAGSPQVKAAISRLGGELAADKAFGPIQVVADKAGDLTLLQTPVAGPATGDLALAKVRELRSDYIPRAFTGSGARVYVAGETARNVDYMDVVNGRTPWVIGLVLALSFGLLLIAFRSVVIPAQAIVMNLLSVGAAYGLITLVFEKGVGAGFFGFHKVEAIESWVPLFLFSILFGLSMDYQVFLLSRIREAYDRTGDNRASVVQGVSSTAGLITGAALIMVAVFAGFASGQLVMFQQLGFGLGVAVLLDATVVRILLVPAAMRVLGTPTGTCPRGCSGCPGGASKARRTWASRRVTSGRREPAPKTPTHGAGGAYAPRGPATEVARPEA